MEDKRITIINIIVEDESSIPKVNDLLHNYNDYVLGRIGIPYKIKNMFIICVILDCHGDIASALSGKLGMIPNITSKTLTAKK